MSTHLSPRNAALLLATVAFAWGTNYPVTKLIVRDLPPLWATSLRCLLAALVLLPLLHAQRSFVVPRRGDLPVVFSTALLHMVAFSALVAAGLRYVPANRAIVLGYTTPIWVALGARLFLGERIAARRAVGIAAGLAGLGVLFKPGAIGWGSTHDLYGSALIMLAAFCWAANIVYVRAHAWISTPFQLVFWQVLLAGVLLAMLAAFTEGAPRVAWTVSLAGLLLYSAVVCTALAHWAMSMVNRGLPAVTTSLGLLATPLVGILSAALILGEPLEPSLIAAVTLIIAGIAVGTVPERIEAASSRAK